MATTTTANESSNDVTIEDELEDEVTTEEDSTEDDASDEPSVVDLQAEIARLQARLKVVNSESASRKRTIRELNDRITALETDNSSEEVMNQLNTLRTENESLKVAQRTVRIKDALQAAIAKRKLEPKAPAVLDDLVAAYSKDFADAGDDEFTDIAKNVAARAASERAYQFSKTKVPDTDATRNGDNTTIPETMVDEVARDFGL